jgi:hypothetical protein
MQLLGARASGGIEIQTAIDEGAEIAGKKG